ncbi:dCMP deaminase [Gordonia phage Phendrix]|uniref:Deoxycytidylate deaminase n=1 Tax=Gordonia phage Phendrix TaxID=2593335 RepID=A0A514U172_9CAUD|nr:dCMP deaminase [Gordonia phage Phendrix]QDK02693.1 deoxycytidylate deaminase [Gordonia phage Phendrix]
MTVLTDADETPSRASRITWDEVWLQMAQTIAQRSRCDRAQVGCVLVSRDNQMLACGYNGPAPSFDVPSEHCSDWCPRAKNPDSCDQSYSDCPSSHAEINAIARSDRSRMSNAKAYVSTSLCISCAKALVASGITYIVYITGNDAHRDPQNVVEYLKKCHVEIVGVDSAVAGRETS